MFDDIIQKPRYLKVKWTLELEQDLKSLYGFDKKEAQKYIKKEMKYGPEYIKYEEINE